MSEQIDDVLETKEPRLWVADGWTAKVLKNEDVISKAILNLSCNADFHGSQ